MSNTIPRGAVLLREHIGALKSTVTAWCATHGLDRVQVQRALRGERARMSLRFAVAMQRASGGAVPAESWDEHVEVRR